MNSQTATEKHEWCRCDLDPKKLKTLSRRNNRDGYIRFGSIFLMLAALGVALTLVWNSGWAILVLIVYSIVWSFANAMGHEACHGTPFRSYRLNVVLLYVTSWMVSWEPITVRWVHARHHSYTSMTTDDAEYLLPNPIRRWDLFELLTGWNTNWQYNKELVQLSCGYVNHYIQLSVPESELTKVFRNARIFLTSFVVIVGISIYLQSWLPVVLLLLPRWIGEPMHGVLRATQHGALAINVRDHRKTTRTMYVNPLLQFFYCNMNFHIEHHMFPMVPFHSLERLHHEVKAQMPRPSAGVTGAMSEVFETIRRQGQNPEYVLSK